MRAVLATIRTLTPTQAVVGVVIWLMIIIGAGQAILTSNDGPVPAPCTPQPHVMFNTCATLDTTQVQDRRTHTQAPTEAPTEAPATQAPTTQAPATEAPQEAPVQESAPTSAPVQEAPQEAPQDNEYGADPVTPAPMAPCIYEDGSAPGQTFPCLWDGATMGNGQGDTYVLTSAL